MNTTPKSEPLTEEEIKKAVACFEEAKQKYTDSGWLTIHEMACDTLLAAAEETLSLRAERDADKRRLDWQYENAAQVILDGAGNWCVFIGDNNCIGVAETPRQAIDNAMKEGGS